MKFKFAVLAAAMMVSGCDTSSATVAEQPVEPVGMEVLQMSDGGQVYFDAASIEPDDFDGSPAISGEFVEVLKTNDDGWAYRHSRITAKCGPDHNRATVLKLVDSNNRPVSETALAPDSRTLAEKSAYYRTMTDRLCAADGAPE